MGSVRRQHVLVAFLSSRVFLPIIYLLRAHFPFFFLSFLYFFTIHSLCVYCSFFYLTFAMYFIFSTFLPDWSLSYLIVSYDICFSNPRVQPLLVANNTNCFLSYFYFMFPGKKQQKVLHWALPRCWKVVVLPWHACLWLVCSGIWSNPICYIMTPQASSFRSQTISMSFERPAICGLLWHHSGWHVPGPLLVRVLTAGPMAPSSLKVYNYGLLGRELLNKHHLQSLNWVRRVLAMSIMMQVLSFSNIPTKFWWFPKPNMTVLATATEDELIRARNVVFTRLHPLTNPRPKFRSHPQRSFASYFRYNKLFIRTSHIMPSSQLTHWTHFSLLFIERSSYL